MNREKSFRVSFDNLNAEALYTFRRCESGAFEYGNRSMVAVYCDGHQLTLLDTRYTPQVMNDFENWCFEWLTDYLNPVYQPHINELY